MRSSFLKVPEAITREIRPVMWLTTSMWWFELAGEWFDVKSKTDFLCPRPPYDSSRMLSCDLCLAPKVLLPGSLFAKFCVDPTLGNVLWYSVHSLKLLLINLVSGFYEFTIWFLRFISLKFYTFKVEGSLERFMSSLSLESIPLRVDSRCTTWISSPFCTMVGFLYATLWVIVFSVLSAVFGLFSMDFRSFRFSPRSRLDGGCGSFSLCLRCFYNCAD